MTASQNRSSVLHRNAIDTRPAACRQNQLISQRGRHLPMRRSARQIFRSRRCTHQFVPVIRDRTHLSQLAIRPRFIPFVERNLMSIGIGARSNRRMPRRRNQVRVIVVAIGKMSALFQEEIPPILRFEVCTISIQVVPTKLVKYQHHN